MTTKVNKNTQVSEAEVLKISDDIRKSMMYNWDPAVNNSRQPVVSWDNLENMLANGMVILHKLRDEHDELLKSRQIDHNTLTDLAVENNRLKQQIKVLTEKYSLLSESDTLLTSLNKALIRSKILANFDYENIVLSEYMPDFTDPILRAAINLESQGFTTESYTITYNLNNILEASENKDVSANIIVAVLEHLLKNQEEKKYDFSIVI